MKTLKKEQTAMLNRVIPPVICGRTSVPCGQRKADKGCKCVACASAIKTSGIPSADKVLMLAYLERN